MLNITAIHKQADNLVCTRGWQTQISNPANGRPLCSVFVVVILVIVVFEVIPVLVLILVRILILIIKVKNYLRLKRKPKDVTPLLAS